MKKQKLDLKTIKAKLPELWQLLRRYRVLIFIVILFSIYSILVYRINVLNNQTPSQDDITAKLKTSQSPKIDQSVVDKIKQLQDNSVDVQSLFNQARNNPFQE
ncbi:MAG TPA: hypothetical protein VLF90_00780 [Patescibacteria group bacterium]|nr:hypothetical protein [Patescibacteria group bacterium]